MADRVAGLDAGADDYLPSPCRQRISGPCPGAARRSNVYAPALLTVGNTTLDGDLQYMLKVSSDTVRLNNKEYQLTELFFRHPRQVFSSAHLFEKIWGLDSQAEMDVVWTYIRSLAPQAQADRGGRGISDHRRRGLCPGGDAMLKQMRWRFIGAAMAAFTAVVLTLLCFVNLWNYRSMTDQQDEALSRLLEVEDQQTPFPREKDAPPFDDWAHFSPEVQYSLRFFSVHWRRADGTVLRVNQDHVASLSRRMPKPTQTRPWPTRRLRAMRAATAIWSTRQTRRRWSSSQLGAGAAADALLL
ncbi:MAG: response regulator transcription factor [Evtepia sp.]